MNWRRTVIRLSSIVAGDITILGWKVFCTNPVIGDDFWVWRLHIPASTDYTAEFDRWHWRSTCPEKTCVGYPQKMPNNEQHHPKSLVPCSFNFDTHMVAEWPRATGGFCWLGKAPAAEEWQRLKPQVYEERGRIWSSTGSKTRGTVAHFHNASRGQW